MAEAFVKAKPLAPSTSEQEERRKDCPAYFFSKGIPQQLKDLFLDPVSKEPHKSTEA